MNPLLMRMVSFFVNKKKLIGWAAAGLFAVGSAAVGLSSQEFKDAVCAAEAKDLPPQPAAEGK